MSWQVVSLILGLATLFVFLVIGSVLVAMLKDRNTKAIEAMVANGQAVQHMIGGAIGQAMLTQQPPEAHQ